MRNRQSCVASNGIFGNWHFSVENIIKGQKIVQQIMHQSRSVSMYATGFKYYFQVTESFSSKEANRLKYKQVDWEFYSIENILIGKCFLFYFCKSWVIRLSRKIFPLQLSAWLTLYVQMIQSCVLSYHGHIMFTQVHLLCDVMLLLSLPSIERKQHPEHLCLLSREMFLRRQDHAFYLHDPLPKIGCRQMLKAKFYRHTNFQHWKFTCMYICI